MTLRNDDELLRGRSLSELEDAERRLRRQINKRRPKPSLARRCLGLCLTVPAIAVGFFILDKTIQSEHTSGLWLTTAGVFIIGGLMWIYSDWFE